MIPGYEANGTPPEDWTKFVTDSTGRSVTDYTDSTQSMDTLRHERINQSVESALSVQSVTTGNPSDESVQSAESVTRYNPLDIRRFLPSKPSYWKTALFKLARHTYGLPDADKLFVEWCHAVDIGIPEHLLQEEWILTKSKVSYGPRVAMLDILAKAKESDVPSWISEAMPESEGFQRVILFLWELSEAVFPDPNFFISTRDLAGLFERDASWASRTLRFFCQREILEIVEKGGPHNNKASRYRFTEQYRNA